MRWYYQDEADQEHGPLSTEDLRRLLIEKGDLWIRRDEERERGFLPSANFAEFIDVFRSPGPRRRAKLKVVAMTGVRAVHTAVDADAQPVNRAFNLDQNIAKSADEITGICKGVLCDGVVNIEEAVFLKRWCEQNRDVASEWPMREIALRLSIIFADGKVSDEEREDLRAALQEITGMVPETEVAAIVNPATRLPLCQPPPAIAFAGHLFCATGKFIFGSRKRVEDAIAERGGIPKSNVTEETHYVVIGTVASRDWKHTTFGTKIETAVRYREKGLPINIVAEEHWVRFL